MVKGSVGVGTMRADTVRHSKPSKESGECYRIN
jgi:hypothetical protein